MQIHPRPDDKGNPVKIINPSQPTPLSAFDEPGEVAVIVPEGETPKALNGMVDCYSFNQTDRITYCLAIGHRNSGECYSIRDEELRASHLSGDLL